MTQVLIAPAPLDGLDAEFRTVLLDAGFQLVFPRVGRQMVEAELSRFLPGCRAAVAGSEPYTREVIRNAPDLKVIARVGVGFDAVDVEAATERGIVVTFAPGTNQDSVAEHTMLLILACARKLISQHNQIVAGSWPRNANVPIRGCTLGIVGLGRIGKAVALRGLAFGMNVVVHDPFADADFLDRHSIPQMPLDDVFRTADYLSIHAPLMPQTRHMVNARTLSLMKPKAFLINTSRGGLVNEADLFAALKNQKIAGAGLDVFDEEPPPHDLPLLTLDNVVLTAHTAGVDLRSRDDMALAAAQAIVDISQGRWPAEKVVNPEVRSIFRWD